MPGGLGWRVCLFAFLLSVGQADIPTDLNEGSRSGDLSKVDYGDINESTAEEHLAETTTEKDTINFNEGEILLDQNRKNNHPDLYDTITEQDNSDRTESEWVPGPPVYPPGHINPLANHAESGHAFSGDPEGFSALNHQRVYPNFNIPGGLHLHDELVFPEDPSYVPSEAEHKYLLSSANEGRLVMPAQQTNNGLMSRLIPEEHHTLLHNIPGANNAIVCSKEGELYNFWAPNFECMVCACLNANGWLRPVCVSCSSCTTPPGPIITPTPLPPAPLIPDKEVSCKPLPANVPFQSPLDPCKICVCTETLNQFGKINTEITCQHNPQCVVPPAHVTTTRPIPTPIPTPVCNKLPQEVPFPHPQDPCKLCKCSLVLTPYGIPEQQINCHTNPECLFNPDVDTEIPEIYTELPEPTTIVPEPELELCDRYPENMLFPHPSDSCQICKCTSNLNIFYDKKRITCYVKPNCLPTPSDAPEPYVTPEPQPEYFCERYPVDVLFPHPTDQCKLCKCYRNHPYQKSKKINCFQKPNCLPTPKPTPSPWPVPSPSPQPDKGTCAPLPTGRPFQNPLNPCQICVCIQRGTSGNVEIECEENPQCVLPQEGSTLSPNIVTPMPLPACENFPENVLFPHPNDACQLCKCSLRKRQPYGKPEKVISCVTKPECPPPKPMPKPWPIPTTPAPSPGPELEADSCSPLPTGKPFPNPLNPCQICICTEHGDMFGKHEVNIQCEENTQCVTPSNVPTLPPIIAVPIPLPTCKEFPVNVMFPHPSDTCQLCKCNVLTNFMGVPEPHIDCNTKPECWPSPAPPPGPIPNPEPPHPNEVCGNFPVGTPFDDPGSPCRVCVCTLAPSSGVSHVHFPPTPTEWKIQCYNKQTPECSLMPLPPQPQTERPQPNPYEVCGNYPINTPWNDPTDPCRLCICKFGPAPGALPIQPGSLSHPAPHTPKLHVMCQLKPECYPLPPEPLTTPAPYPSPTPTPDIASCRPLPTGTPFQNPLNPCQVCVCTEAADLFGKPDVIIKCQENPQCVLPIDVTTVPPSPIIPVPLPACAKFPPNVEFPHPQDQCQLCKCSAQVTPWGPQEQHISCHIIPECEPPSLTTVTPPAPGPVPLEPSICNEHGQDELFPHPQDPCRICKCTLEKTPFGTFEEKINCFKSPACSPTPAPSTRAPWPPAPPGPLPGPSPHESCTPYIPNKPFQHPWDDCQVCVCREAVSAERISIEVNCYTKPSCCIELPFETPGSSSSSGMMIRPSSGDIIGPSIGHIIGPSGGHMIGPSGGHMIGPSGGHMIGPSGGHMIEPSDGYMIGPTGGHMIGPSGGHMIGPLGEIKIGSSGENLIGPLGGNIVKPWSVNIIGSSSENYDRPSGGHFHRPEYWNEIEIPHVNVNSPPGQNWIGHSSGNLIGPADGNVIDTGNPNVFGPTSQSLPGTAGNLIRPLDVNLHRPLGQNVIGHSSENYYEPLDENVIGSSSEKVIRPHPYGTTIGNLNRPLSGTLNRPLSKNINYIRANGNLMGPNLPSYIRPGGSSGNLLLNIKPLGNTFGTGGRVNMYHTGNGQAASLTQFHRVLLENGPFLKHIGPTDRDETYPSRVDHEISKAKIEGSAPIQVATAKAEVSAVSEYKGSTKMRTKSARPSDDDSMDYD